MCDFLDDSNVKNTSNITNIDDQFLDTEDNQSVCSSDSNPHSEYSSGHVSIVSNIHSEYSSGHVSIDSSSQTYNTDRSGVNVDDMSISNVNKDKEKDKDNDTPYLLYNNEKIFVSMNEINYNDLNSQNVIMAVLFNYEDEKNESNFKTIYLPVIKITYTHLINLFFNNCGKGFSPLMINIIWNNIKGFSLAKTYLKILEDKHQINYNNLTALTKIKLYKECAFNRITEKAYITRALNLEELNIALGSIDPRLDHSLCVNINIQLYSKTLNVGLKVIMPFSVIDVPCHVRGVSGDTDTIIFDFCS